MPLSPGDKLGPYEILSPIGAGGMGEVYKARDTRLDRTVAIKVSKEKFSERFEREARSIAALNHPNICHIYDVGPNYLVMELVEGSTLAERIKAGALPLDEALAIARQIGDALEAAHEKGIVHRDLKPTNIKIKSDGGVKVLDFGLAKMAEATVVAGSPEESPTLTMEATRAGQILGTASYMAPEQARGKTVDKRADIWAFGVVLYEMLSGRRLFTGETISDTLVAVLKQEPDWNRVPMKVQRLLKSCLEKDPKRRLRDIADSWRLLEDAPVEPFRATRIAWVLAGATTALAIVALWAPWRGGEGALREVMHLDIVYPPNVEPLSGLQGGVAISPDGHNIAMMGVRDGVRRLYIRRLDRAEVAEINDLNGINAAFSPDSASVAFRSTVSVIQLSLADRQRAVVGTGADVTSSFAWGPREIVYTRGGALWAVPTTGGTARQLTVLDPARHEVVHTD